MPMNCAGYNHLKFPMPPNNNNLTSAWSRQMQNLRQQVDRIDLKMLQLLQQRIKLSGQIGKMKRRHGAVIYVPERERELVARLSRVSKGQPSQRAVAAIYREVLSSSRAAQGQAPIGVLQKSAAVVLPASRAGFGACDQFSLKKTWTDVVKGLDTGALSLALVTGEDLAGALRTDQARKKFFFGLTTVGDFPPLLEPKAPLKRRIFIVTPRGNGAPGQASEALILIECKFTANAIKSLLRSMPDFSLQAESLTVHPAQRGIAVALARLSLAESVDGLSLTSHLLKAGQTADLSVSILGIYPGTEDHGG